MACMSEYSRRSAKWWYRDVERKEEETGSSLAACRSLGVVLTREGQEPEKGENLKALDNFRRLQG